jgi:hypothetical protein
MSNIRTYALAIAAACFITGSQAAAQGGPSVTINPTPLPVTVTNPTVPPSTVNIGNPAALAAAISQALLGTPVAFITTLSAGFVVPVGKRLVIEYVSGVCSTAPSAPDGRVSLTVTTNGQIQDHAFSSTVFPMASQQTFAQFGHVVKIYADPGTTVAQTGANNCSGLSVSGRLVMQ